MTFAPAPAAPASTFIPAMSPLDSAVDSPADSAALADAREPSSRGTANRDVGARDVGGRETGSGSATARAENRGCQQHHKITEYLRAQIQSGELKPGDQLPSEAELCKLFSISRGPVRQGIAALRAKGYISSGRGRRSVVLGRAKTESFDAIISVTAWLEANGFCSGQRTLWLARCPAPAHAAKALKIQPEDPVIFVHRIRTANGEPIMVERQYFPLDIGQKLLNFDADSGSIHEHLREQGVDFDNVHRTLVLANAAEDDAQPLGVKVGDPLFLCHIEIADHSGKPVEYADYRYRPDRTAFGITNVRGGTSPLEVVVHNNVVHNNTDSVPRR